MEQELGLDVLVEGRFVAHLAPRRHDDEHEDDDRQHRHDHEDRGREPIARWGASPALSPARDASSVTPRATLWRGRSEDGRRTLKRRLLIRRIVSIAALTLVVTGLAAIGLNADVFAGFQRRATDSLFPAAPDDGDIAVVGFDTKTINTEGSATRCHGQGRRARRQARRRRRRGHRVRRHLPQTRRTPATTRSRDAIDRAGNVILARDPTIGPARDGVYTTSDMSSLSRAGDRRRTHAGSARCT